jgi:hypothetical protein
MIEEWNVTAGLLALLPRDADIGAALDEMQRHGRYWSTSIASQDDAATRVAPAPEFW